MDVFSRYTWLTWFNHANGYFIDQPLNSRDKGKFANASTLNGIDVTIILTVWKRNNIAEQLYALVNQTEKSYQIWICHYEDHWGGPV